MSDDTPPAWAEAMEERLMAATRAEVNAVRAEMGAMRSDIGTMRSDIGTMRSDMATRRDVADIMARIDRLQENLTRQQESSVVELGTAEMALRKNENTRSDVQTLTDMVLALTRNMRRMDAEIRQMRGDGAA